jgi:hypothetical protein
MDSLKALDIYGQPISFTINSQQKFKTLAGALMSLVTLGLAIFFTIIFGSDFFNRLNPRVSIETQVFPKGNLVSVNPTNFNFGFRIYNVGNSSDSIDQYLHSFATNVYFFSNKTFGNNEINITNCTKENAPDIYQKYPNQKYKCLDLNGDSNTYQLGGGQGYDFYYYIFIQFSRCSPNDPSLCFNKTKIDAMVNNLDNYWVIEFVYSQTIYSGENNNALTQVINVKKYPLDFVFVRTDYFSFENVKLDDDVGVITAEHQEYEKLSIQSRETTTSFFGDERIKYEDLGFIQISLNNQRPVIKRIYMKLQDLAAILGGFMNIIMSASSVMTVFINTYLRKLFIFNIIFENKPPKDIKKRKR